jgi:hypothetical protein
MKILCAKKLWIRNLKKITNSQSQTRLRICITWLIAGDKQEFGDLSIGENIKSSAEDRLGCFELGSTSHEDGCFWDAVPCSLVEIALTTETAISYETFGQLLPEYTVRGI